MQVRKGYGGEDLCSDKKKKKKASYLNGGHTKNSGKQSQRCRYRVVEPDSLLGQVLVRIEKARYAFRHV